MHVSMIALLMCLGVSAASGQVFLDGSAVTLSSMRDPGQFSSGDRGVAQIPQPMQDHWAALMSIQAGQEVKLQCPAPTHCIFTFVFYTCNGCHDAPANEGAQCLAKGFQKLSCNMLYTFKDKSYPSVSYRKVLRPTEATTITLGTAAEHVAVFFDNVRICEENRDEVQCVSAGCEWKGMCTTPLPCVASQGPWQGSGGVVGISSGRRGAPRTPVPPTSAPPTPAPPTKAPPTEAPPTPAPAPAPVKKSTADESNIIVWTAGRERPPATGALHAPPPPPPALECAIEPCSS